MQVDHRELLRIESRPNACVWEVGVRLSIDSFIVREHPVMVSYH